MMTTQTYKTLFRVTSYKLEADTIVTTICGEDVDTDIYIPRSDYEDWLTEGTGVMESVTDHYDAALPDGHRQQVCAQLVRDYWAHAQEINNEQALLHLHAWLTRTEQEAIGNLAYLRAEKVISVIECKGIPVTTDLRYEIKEAIMDYGAASRQWMIAATAAATTNSNYKNTGL